MIFIYVLALLYMQGMGEPLNNYNALVEAIQVLTASPFQISPKRVTVSTVSILPYIVCLHVDISFWTIEMIFG
jgi:adenine C2-methylase RlmN of 23S rRNA A2503 and tRNA A37